MPEDSKGQVVSPQPSASSDDIDLGRLVGLLVDHKWTIAGITGVFAAAGVAHALLATPIYSSDAMVQIEDKSPISNPLQDLTGYLGQTPSSDAEMQIIQSRLVLGQAVNAEALDVVVTPHRWPVIGDFLARMNVERPFFAEGGSSVWASERVAIAMFQVDSQYQGRNFTLTVEDEGRFRLSLDGEDLGEGIVGENAQFLDGAVTLRISENSAPPGAEFDLVKRSELSAINSVRSSLTVAPAGRSVNVLSLTYTDPDRERGRRTLEAITQVYLQQNIQRSSAEAEQSLQFLQEQLPQVREELTAAEEKLNTYRIQQDSVDLPMETQSVLTRLVNIDSQINQLEFAEADISRRFTPSHPTYAALLQKKQQLQQERGNLNREINALPETQQQILRLQRDVEVNQQVYVQMLNRVQETNIIRASTVGNVRIIDNAVSQPGPISPQKGLIVAISTIVGLLLALCYVLVRSFFNRGIESPDQIEAINLPVYATVPLSEEQLKLTRRVKSSSKGPSAFSGLLALHNPSDLSIEAIRGLRTSLHFAMLESDDNVLMITGPSPGIGKSFIAANLAEICAQGEQKVLLIDADMRKGHIHDALQLKAHGGLSDYLSGQSMLTEVIKKTANEKLDVITRGSAPPNPAELLMGSRFTAFLKEVKEQYDLVIIDTPPVLAVTDALIVGRQVGTTMTVVRFAYNPIRELEQMRRKLENGGVNLKGAILNAVERKAATSYGYGYYNYSYK
ncbi:polysaccharide biosynthesis tyrosine autokinase [Halotalea alkalilenta]|uniref:Tyrosine protein kinase n=1 Tax=Halotalea alkalilenta TaxID=376489 RepID=A0A172YGS5_9GAMM|nr:polysaccharide biosynthesis tyrosine autokinase [Halotalea alkalilenta]ANF58407.1 tyrosine protein kinase [Halotalea alkalilenta]